MNFKEECSAYFNTLKDKYYHPQLNVNKDSK